MASILTEGIDRNYHDAKMCRTYRKANDYGNHLIKFIGKTTRNVEMKDATNQHTFLVVNNNLLQLFGRDVKTLISLKINSSNPPQSNKLQRRDTLFNKCSEFLLPSS